MSDPRDFWNRLDPRYKLILCDVWGVVHDGYSLYDGAAERLCQWRTEGRFVLLITNAPRTAEAVEQHVRRVGLPDEAWDAIATSGDAGIAGLLKLGSPVGFLGTVEDRSILEGRGVRIVDDGFTDRVFSLDPYASDTGRDAFNDSDPLYQRDLELKLSKEGAAYLGLITVDVARA